MTGTILVIPCYNESDRLLVKAFQKESALQFIFVNDGSTDITAKILDTQFSNFSHCHILHLPKNVGKAEAVRAGINHALNLHLPSSWIGFWDADLATPLSEVSNFTLYAKSLYEDIDAIWGSRVYRLGAVIKRSALRHYLGRVFATIVAFYLGVEAYDTQCGAKLFKTAIAKEIAKEPFLSRWIFDIEILLRLKKYKIIEYPVLSWQDIPGSKIKISLEIFRALKDIYRIRRKYQH